MNRILLVEDDPVIVRLLTEYLTGEGFSVTAVPGERAAGEALASFSPSLLLVDVSLSDGNGFGVCRRAKEKGLPVIFLTASGDENSVVAGLDMGADDYVAKPFRPRELTSRIRSVLRRSAPESDGVLTAGNLRIDTEKGEVCKNGTELPLSALEYRLLSLFAGNRGRLLTREQILNDIWDVAGDFVNDNTLTVYIKRLREKIEEDPAAPQLIRTVRGLGYRMD